MYRMCLVQEGIRSGERFDLHRQSCLVAFNESKSFF